MGGFCGVWESKECRNHEKHGDVGWGSGSNRRVRMKCVSWDTNEHPGCIWTSWQFESRQCWFSLTTRSSLRGTVRQKAGTVKVLVHRPSREELPSWNLQV